VINKAQAYTAMAAAAVALSVAGLACGMPLGLVAFNMGVFGGLIVLMLWADSGL
jgi:hypothetical protein